MAVQLVREFWDSLHKRVEIITQGSTILNKQTSILAISEVVITKVGSV